MLFKLNYFFKERYPLLEPFENGVWCPLSHALPRILKETLEIKDGYNPSIDSPDSLELIAFVVLYYDGSGSHQQMKGNDIDINTRNIIMGIYSVHV